MDKVKDHKNFTLLSPILKLLIAMIWCVDIIFPANTNNVFFKT